MYKPRIVLKKGKTDSLERRHPWVFSGAIKEIFGNPEDGDLVDVTGAKGEYYGAGHFQNGSIAVRMLTFKKETVDDNFFRRRLQSALNYRLSLGFSPDDSGKSNAWRLVYGEADMLPGLIIDLYNNVAVIQAHSAGFHRIADKIAAIVADVLGDSVQGVYYKMKEVYDSEEDRQGKSELLWGKLPDELIITEYGSRFYIDVQGGQKTGFFLDQRENRNLLSQYSGQKNVLNMFCYSGGFSVSALKGGASLVYSVDASASAIALAEENIVLNAFNPHVHKCIVADAFEFMETTEMNWDVIILDPPAYAKHADARHRAVKGYQRLNATAMKMVKTGGFIFTFSCSQVVDRRLFESTVMSAAIISGRHVRVVQELTHAPCHAHAITHPEGKYLKGLLLHVE